MPMYAVGGQIRMETKLHVLPMQWRVVNMHITESIFPDYIGSEKPADEYP